MCHGGRELPEVLDPWAAVKTTCVQMAVAEEGMAFLKLSQDY